MREIGLAVPGRAAPAAAAASPAPAAPPATSAAAAPAAPLLLHALPLRLFSPSSHVSAAAMCSRTMMGHMEPVAEVQIGSINQAVPFHET